MQEVLDRLSPQVREVLNYATFQPLYLVGGSVRDALLPLYTGQAQPLSRDLDLLVEENAPKLGQALQSAFGGELTCHAEFMTCTLTRPDLTVDIATAREETYPFPGALPQVKPSSLEKDLFRRDFTLNALALRLSPEPVTFIDLFNGLEDLKQKQLRTLHKDSFIDDPTRILRGARLAGRLGFSFHPDTRGELAAALEAGAAQTVSAARLKNELLLTLAEPQVAPALNLMERDGVLDSMLGLHADVEIIERLDGLRLENPIPDESYLLILLLSVPENKLPEHAAKFSWPKKLLVGRQLLLKAQRSELDLGADLDPAVYSALKVLEPKLSETLEKLAKRRKVRGQDVLDLGLPQGPEVGNVLAEVAKARANGQADSFQEELNLAKTLVEQRLAALAHQETS